MPRKPAAARKPAAKKAQPSAARRLSSELPAPPSKRAGGADLTLRCLGFCGADDSADPASLRAISEAHEWVEWGVLFRPDKAGQPRYASAAWLRRLAKANVARRMRLAAHLCGARVDEVLRGETAFVRKVTSEVGFQRVQINATAVNGVDVGVFASAAGAKRCAAAVRAAAAALPHVEFIIQRNGLTRRLWEQLDDAPPPNLSFLFDESMGTGVATAAWPPPPAGMELFGYAGGLNPGNVRAQIVAMGRAAAGRTLWCDMESGAPPPPPPPVATPRLSFPPARAGVRTARPSGEDIFDLDKCMACVRHAIALKVVPATASVFGGRATKRRRA